jgi:hypothetical protein
MVQVRKRSDAIERPLAALKCQSSRAMSARLCVETHLVPPFGFQLSQFLPCPRLPVIFPTAGMHGVAEEEAQEGICLHV